MSAAVGRRHLEARRLELSVRDLAVLQSIRNHRFLTSGQIARWHFARHRSPSAGIRACVRVMTRLRGLRLITRLDRSVGGLHAGSKAFIWTLDVAGDRLLRRDAAEATPRQGRRFIDPSRAFLEHALAVAELHVQLVEAARSDHVELVDVETEPACWRDYVAAHGSAAVLKPDLAVVTASGEYEDHYYVELDRGTESTRTRLAKCEQYERYRSTGREQAERGVFPFVVWVMPDEKRRDRLLAEIESSRTLDTALYRVVTAADFIGLVTGQSPPGEAHVTELATSTQQRRNS